MKLPSFICIGAQKAGTTSLQDILQQHPDIYLSPIKEIKYFHRDEHYSKGIEWYSQHFKEALPNQIIGDITPDYILYQYAAKRIFDDLGKDIKIIVLLRNPVDRAFSQFNFHQAMKVEDETSFKKIIKNYPPIDLENKIFINWFTPAYYIERGLYFNQLQRFYSLFPKENIHVVLFEDLFGSKHTEEIEGILSFLGVSTNMDVNIKHSHSTRIPKNNFATKMINQLKNVKQFLKLLLPKKIYLILRSNVVEFISKKPSKLDLEFRKELFNTYFKNDVTKLEQLIGKDFSIWK